jgi:Protein of unknown function (DUF3489)
MTKPKTKPKAATRSTARKTAKPASRKRSAPASSRSAARPDTKHARIIALLRTPAGATIASLVTATQWQQHSVRGFLVGVVRKKLGLNLVSEQTDKGRVYRIKDGNASPASANRAKQAACAMTLRTGKGIAGTICAPTPMERPLSSRMESNSFTRPRALGMEAAALDGYRACSAWALWPLLI